MKNGWHLDELNNMVHYFNNKIHNLHSPARFTKNNKVWIKNGQRHRWDGPAEMWNSNLEKPRWYCYGKIINCSSQKEFEYAVGIRKISLVKNGWYDENGDLVHYVNNIRHNIKSPSEISRLMQGFMISWNDHGKLHREDGPAFICGRHRQWYYDGIEYNIQWNSKEDFNRKLKLKSLW